MLVQEWKLLGRRWRLELDSAAIADAMNLAKPRYLLHWRLAEPRRQVCTLAVSALVPRDQLRPVRRQHGHEVLARALTQVQHPAPNRGGPRCARRLDDRLDSVGPI